MTEKDKKMEVKEPVTAERIKKFVQQNRRVAKDGRKCVDGRYLPDSPESGKIARGGADGGYIQALLALKKQGKINWGVREIVGKVKEIVEADGGLLTIHTDHHASRDTKDPKIGCGHLGKAEEPDKAPDYLVSPEDMEFAVIYLKELWEQGRIKVVDLPREHEESFVLEDEGEKYGIDPNDGEISGFIYNRKRDEDFVEKRLYPALELKDVSFEDFMGVLDKQTGATLKYLAKGMPYFKVNSDMDDPKIEDLGVI